MANIVRSLMKTKPNIAFILNDDQQEAFAPTYTSLDQINGNVVITPLNDTKFDEVYITFEGVAKTYVEKVATTSPTNGRTEAFQSFLRLVQPVERPASTILKAGETYRFPFTFVVPERRLPQSCTHSVDNQTVSDMHLALPPSMGDPMMASERKHLLDDMCPDMAVVSYALKARITQGRGPNGKHIIIAEGARKVRIVPAVEEHPPLDVRGDCTDDYKPRAEKLLKKGFFKGKLGCLVAEADQPKSLRLPSVRAKWNTPITTMARVNVRFDPANENTHPPSLGSLATKLKIVTFYASVPMKEIPIRSSEYHYSSIKGLYVDVINLSSRCIGSTQWEKYPQASAIRRDSALSTVSGPGKIPDPSPAYKGQSFYVASLVVPITLPRTKVFLPTFHSCLMSRVYALDFYLSTSGTGLKSSMHLKVPIQISSEGNPHNRPSISEDEAAAIARREASEYFTPRSIAPPITSFNEPSLEPRLPQARHDMPPPGYGILGRQMSVRVN